MTRAARFTKDDVRRAVTGVEASGLPVARVEFEGERIVVFIGAPGKERPNPLDKLYGS